jgi:hypothetical protein
VNRQSQLVTKFQAHLRRLESQPRVKKNFRRR